MQENHKKFGNRYHAITEQVVTIQNKQNDYEEIQSERLERGSVDGLLFFVRFLNAFYSSSVTIDQEMKDYTMPSKPTAGGKEQEKNDPAAEENNCPTLKRSTRKTKF